jgi:hypothetical protein
MRVTVAVHGHLRNTSSVGHDEISFTLPDAGGMRIRDLLETLSIFDEEVGEVTLWSSSRRGAEAPHHPDA